MEVKTHEDGNLILVGRVVKSLHRARRRAFVAVQHRRDAEDCDAGHAEVEDSAHLGIGQHGRQVERRGGEHQHDDGLLGGSRDLFDERRLGSGEGDVRGVVLSTTTGVGVKRRSGRQSACTLLHLRPPAPSSGRCRRQARLCPLPWRR